MTIPEATKRGATHYRAMKDGITPQLFYKENKFKCLEYISFSGAWFGSNLNGDDQKLNILKSKLTKI